MEQFNDTPHNNSENKEGNDKLSGFEGETVRKEIGSYHYYERQIKTLKAEKIELETYLEPIKNMEKEEGLFSQTVKDAINNLSTALEDQIRFATEEIERQQEQQNRFVKDKFTHESKE